MAATNSTAPTVWLTGLSGAGKTTIGREVVSRLRTSGIPAVLLDGDEIRANLTRELGYSREDRDRQVERVGWLCGLLNDHGVIAVAAVVSPYRATRDLVRSRIADFIEVHVDATLQVLESRDPKGYYRRSRDGSMAGLTGVDAPYEPPLAPEIVCRNIADADLAVCVDAIVRYLDATVSLASNQER